MKFACRIRYTPNIHTYIHTYMFAKKFRNVFTNCLSLFLLVIYYVISAQLAIHLRYVKIQEIIRGSLTLAKEV
jgi:hypothetical protein